MGDNSDPGGIKDKSFLIPRSESKSTKRGFVDVGERSELGHKRLKMKDLETVFRSESRGIDTHYSKSWMKGQAAEKDTVTMNLDVTKKGTLQPVVGAACTSLDLNAIVDMTIDLTTDSNPACANNINNLTSNSKPDTDKSRGLGFDLNVEDVSSSAVRPNKQLDQLKLRDDSECGSTCSPMEEKYPMKVWKEMKQNGFMSSSSHGGVPIPKQRGRKSKADGVKKKMEIARREQVDRFAKIAAPTGLLNGLNPGIINHVRNSKQVHSIIEALVRSEKRDNFHTGNKEENIQMKTERIEPSDNHGNLNLLGKKRNNLCPEDGPLNNASKIRKTSNFPISSENIRNNDSSMVQNSISDRTKCFSYFNMENQDTKHALKVSSSATMPSQNISTLCDEDSTDFSSVSSLSFKAANVASRWLELLQQDIKGRLGALRRSKKRVRAVIQTELPLLLSREFSHNQENDPYVTKIPVPNISVNATADIHKARWSALFNQMENALSEEERQLENWFNQVKEMQLQCDRGLSQSIGRPGMQQQGTSETDCRIGNSQDSESVLAVRAAAAALYSTCNLSQSVQNFPCV